EACKQQTAVLPADELIDLPVKPGEILGDWWVRSIIDHDDLHGETSCCHAHGVQRMANQGSTVIDGNNDRKVETLIHTKAHATPPSWRHAWTVARLVAVLSVSKLGPWAPCGNVDAEVMR